MKNILYLFLAFWVTMAPVLAQSGVSPNSGITVGAPKNPTTDAPTDAAYGVVVPNSSLPNARTLTGSTNIGVTDGGAGGAVTFAVTGQIPIANGGTAASTQQGAANAVLNFPGLTSQDLFYYNGTNTARFPKGSNNTYLSTNGSGNIEWAGSPSGIASTAPVLMFGTDGSASASRAVTAGTGISITDGGPMGNATFAIDSTVATLTGTQVLTNKTLTAPTMGWNSGSGFNLAGSTFNSALKWADWAAARNLTIPDPGADASFVLTEGAQTLNGVKTFGSTPVLSTGALTVGGNTVTIPSAADTLVNLASTQSLSNKTISAPVFTTGYDLKTGSFALQHTWDAPAANRAYVIKDVGGAAHYVMKDTTSAYTAGAIPYGDGSKLVVGSAGTSGQPLLSGGTGAYTFGTLGPTVGGTNQTTYATGDILYASGANTLAKLAIGSSTNVLTVTGGVPVWAAASAGTLILNSLPFMTAGSGSLTASATTGDIIYGSGSNAYSKLAIGSTGQFLKVAAGAPSWAAGPAGFGGDGNAGAVTKGAVTETTRLQLNATTFSQTVSTTWAPLSGTMVNATTTCAFNGTTTVATGCSGGAAARFMYISGSHGSGLSGGSVSAQNAGGGGGGNAGAGGDGGCSTASYALSWGGVSNPISSTGGSGGGGGGAYSSNTAGAGGPGGGCLIACSVGAMTVGASGTINAKGTAGTAGTTDASGGGGGSGGTVSLNSQTSIANSGTINVSGGNGGAGSGASAAGGGGGGGGYVQFVSPSNTNGTRTVSGGSAGATGTQAAVAGSAGLAVSITATPNLPLLLSMQSDNFARMKSIALAHKVLNFPTKAGFDVELTQREAAQACSRGSVIQFAKLVDGNMTESTCLEIGDAVEDLLNAA